MADGAVKFAADGQRRLLQVSMGLLNPLQGVGEGELLHLPPLTL